MAALWQRVWTTKDQEAYLPAAYKTDGALEYSMCASTQEGKLVCKIRESACIMLPLMRREAFVEKLWPKHEDVARAAWDYVEGIALQMMEEKS